MAFVIFSTSIMALFKIHQRFKGHFLNKLSFENSQELELTLYWYKNVKILSKQIFGFLSWLSTYVFITNCWLNGYVYTLDRLIHDSQNVCKCLTLNKMHIKLASLIICATNKNLTNTPSTLPPEVKKNHYFI